jgi:hypothetical protein
MLPRVAETRLPSAQVSWTYAREKKREEIEDGEQGCVSSNID